MLRAIGEYYLRLGALRLDKALVEFDVVDAGEGMPAFAAAERVKLVARHRIRPGIDALILKHLGIDKVIAHLVRGVGEQYRDLFGAPRDAL